MVRFSEEGERKFQALFRRLTPTYPGKCLRFNALDGRHVIADDTQQAADLWRNTFGPLNPGEYLEIISNTFPTS